MLTWTHDWLRIIYTDVTSLHSRVAPPIVHHYHAISAMFGPFVVSSTAGLRRITSPSDAIAFMRSLDHTSRPHWRIASRMVEWAWMSAADEEAANMAFRNALEVDGLLHN